MSETTDVTDDRELRAAVMRLVRGIEQLERTINERIGPLAAAKGGRIR